MRVSRRTILIFSRFGDQSMTLVESMTVFSFDPETSTMINCLQILRLMLLDAVHIQLHSLFPLDQIIIVNLIVFFFVHVDN
jgi:hypothetical protein